MILGAIADDFTGASDLANTLAKGGMRTFLYAGIPAGGASAGSVARRRPESGLMRHALGADPRTTRGLMDEMPELRLLFHLLNNQLGVILAHAELLHAKVPDDASRARAAQVR